MNSGDRFRSLVVVWVGVVALAGFTFLGKDQLNVGEVVLGVFYMIALIGGTLGIVVGTSSESASKAKSHSGSTVKMKREESSLIDRMVESMDDEERAALLRRLGVPDPYPPDTENDLMMTDDGEIKHRR